MPLVCVTGPPCSGKSTYAQERAGKLRADGHPDPIIVDWDLIGQALGSTQHHGHAEHMVPVINRLRGLTVKAAIDAVRDTGCWAIIVDTLPTDARLAQYRAAGAEFVELTASPDELHARAGAQRPALWHRLIDDWAPTRVSAGPAWQVNTTGPRKPWPKRPAHRKGAHGHRYERLRAAFLAQHSVCQRCGEPFVTDAPCNHPRCIKRGKGCWFHPLYPTVQHTVHLADGGPSMDVSTWQAWHQKENQSDGGKFARARQLGRAQDRTGGTVDLTW